MAASERAAQLSPKLNRPGSESAPMNGHFVRYMLRRLLFFLIGFLTLDLFFLVAALGRTGKTELAAALAIPMRILIVPMYVFWLLATMPIVALDKHVALSGLVRGILSGISMVAGFAPYVLADYIRARLRRTR
jgi:hypothetical protein